MAEPTDVNGEDSIDINLRPVGEVVRRAVLLISLVRRAGMEQGDPGGDENDAFERETDRFELYSWARKELANAGTDDEQALLNTPAGELAPAQADRCLSASLPASALCWSLGVVGSLSPGDADNPPLDQLFNWAPQPWDEASRFAKNARLRDEETIAQEREKWELWYWRATLEAADLEPDEDLDELLGDVVGVAADAGLIDVIDGDFSLDGKAFELVNPDRQATIAHLSEDYLRALNWVCGFGDSWESVPLYPD